MCGLTGGWTLRRFDALREALPRMTRAIVHRGPDDSGHWFDADAGFAIGHRRLSIVDLSPAGHQPMLSAGGRYAVAYNGEIYNHLALRAELEAAGGMIAWRGHSDTETLLAAVERWGFEETLRKLVGMFAIALWDRRDRMLLLARDRLGEKPLYYGWNNQQFLFGSEIKALRQAPGFDAPIDRDALTLYMRHGAVPAPWSIHRGIRKLMPGTWLAMTARDIAEQILPEPRAYWSTSEAAARGNARRFAGSDREAIDELERLLCESVKGQMLADVPLGAFLSGGVDSSTIVALMQSVAARPVRTFTIGFSEAAYNEAEHAKAVARHLGTDHTELYVTPNQAQDLIPRLPHYYDEPFADSSQVPTLLVCEMARRHVTVCLSGDAGDELFLGYTRYEAASQYRRLLTAVPSVVRRIGAAGLRRLPSSALLAVGKVASGLRMNLSAGAFNRERAARAADLLSSSATHGYYPQMMTSWPDAVVSGSHGTPGMYDEVQWPHDRDAFIEQLGRVDLADYLPNDILVKVDRAAMAVSLETRVPLLDHRIVEFAMSLPLRFKRRDGRSKWLLRQLLYRHVPSALIERPKMGFGVPVEDWLRGPLREWASSLLDPARLRSEGHLDADMVASHWRQHLTGERNWQARLWSVLMFEAWLGEISGATSPSSGSEVMACTAN